MGNDIKSYSITPHAWERWEQRFPGLDFAQVFARAIPKFEKGGDYHLHDPETSAEFVCRRSKKGEWYVITVLLWVERFAKMRARRPRKWN